MKKFNIHFFILFFISIEVFLSDIIIYFFNTNFLLTNIFIGIFLFGITYFLYKKEKIKIKFNFDKFDLLFLIPFFIYMIFTIVFPDLSWDTRSYHIYLQENIFLDKINYDFFAGRNLNSFLFPLGDRINYLFRNLLGYRLGTIMSYYLIMILFYQIKEILSYFFDVNNKKNIIFSSLLISLTSIVFSYTGTYYIDNYSLIFILEIFLIIFCEENILKEKIKLYILASLIGISISVKVTNIIFLIPLGIYFLIKNVKKIKFYDYIIFLILAILPWIVYAINNYIQTKNPVFPYYNNIFKSEYFMQKAWEDKNFGPINFYQTLIWPIYIVFKPLSAFDTKFVDITWAVGYIAILGYIMYCLIKRNIKENKLFYLSIIVFINYLLWTKFLIGYVRYATILLILSLIITVSIIEKFYRKTKKVGIVFLCLLILSIMPSIGYDFFIKIKDYKSFNELISEYKINFSKIIKDRKTKKIKTKEILGAIGDDSLLSALIRNDNKIYNLEEWVTITNEKTEELYNNKIKNNIILVPVDKLTKTIKEDYLNRNNFKILEIEKIEGDYNFLSPNDELYLYKVQKLD